jgi:glycosyltransferase involved in cell wall biosynthesis
LLIAFSVIVALQLFYLFFLFRRLADYEQVPIQPEVSIPVSVIICTHNELNNLKRNLPSILEQKYPTYEVIVVNDNSSDETELLLMQFESKFPHLLVRHIKNQSHHLRGKKYPLTIGIRAAKYDHVLLTDIDCVTSSDHWIRDMAGMFTDKKEIVLGYAPYKKYPGFLNKFIRYETFITAMQYFSFAIVRIPYMGVGRNLAYRKQIFFDHNIYPKYPQLISGDDDLLINHAANKNNTAIQISKSSFVYSEPKQTADEYWFQKRRHVSTGKYYKWHHRFLLGLLSIINLLFYPIFLVCVLYSGFGFEAGILFLIKFFLQAIVYNSIMKKLEVFDLFLLFPLMDLAFLFYYLKLLPHVNNPNTDRWK